MITTTRLKELLRSVSQIRLGVIGDFCLDAYWRLDEAPAEISLETGRPTHAVIEQRYSPGGAGNVAQNLAALGVRQVSAFGLRGDDLFGGELQRQLSALGISNELVVQDGQWQTAVYAKPCVGNEERDRIDFGRHNVLSPASEHTLISNVTEAMDHLDGVIVNQQLTNGVHTPSIVKSLNALAAKHSDKIFLVDARQRLRDFSGMISKLNVAEAAQIVGNTQDNTTAGAAELEQFAASIFAFSRKPVFITRGERGLVCFDGQSLKEFAAVGVREPIDTVGAGDTVVAALAASLAAGASLEDAASIATIAAAVTIRKLQQTGTATPDEILAMAASRLGIPAGEAS